MLALLRVYKLLLSPLYPGACRFLPSCSDYAAAALLLHARELRALAQPIARREAMGHGLTSAGGGHVAPAFTRRGVYLVDLDTVRRLRPLARRRLSTRRPFFVSMRTRNP